MMTKEEYKKELVRMWDMKRGNDYKGSCDCDGVPCCEECAFYQNGVHCGSSTNAFEMIEAVEKWSKEHPKKHKVSKLEYDILEENLKWVEGAYYLKFYDIWILKRLLKKGHFNGATSETNVKYYFDNCEVVDNDE